MNPYVKLGAGDIALPDDADRDLVRGILIKSTQIIVAPLVANKHKPADYKKALKTSAALNFDGHRWRAPEIEEVLLLPDRRRFAPALDPEYFWWLIEAMEKSGCSWIWTATADASDPEVYAWYLRLGNGGSSLNNQNNEGLPLAVRGPVSVPGQ